MWTRSKPERYTSFRTFIFGITNQSMFPNGVVYEGYSEEPLFFRGESGANDSMVCLPLLSSQAEHNVAFVRTPQRLTQTSQIPLCDNLLQITIPPSPLTDILSDFRSYRPGNHRLFLERVRTCADDYGVRAFAEGDPASASLYLRALDGVREFRWRHWRFAREYVLKNTGHPTATGGSPIVTVGFSLLPFPPVRRFVSLPLKLGLSLRG